MDEMHERTSLQNLHKKKKIPNQPVSLVDIILVKMGQMLKLSIRAYEITNVESTIDILLLAVNSRTKSVKKIILTTSTA